MDAKALVGKLARLIPPPRKNAVRYFGALAPNSPLRPLLAAEATSNSGVSLSGKAADACRKVLSAAAKSWAACLRRVFEIDPFLCANCGGQLEPIAFIFEDRQLVRILEYLGLPTDLPKTVPARGPPPVFDEESQLMPDSDLSLGIDPIPADDLPAA